MGITSTQHLTEGMCRQCAWQRIKQKCKICGDIIGKGFPRLIAHTATHYTSSKLSYDEVEKNIILVNFENQKASNQIFVENGYDYVLRCKVCGNCFTFRKEKTMLSKWIGHIKSHYIDKELVKKQWVAKDMIHFNYEPVLEITSSDQHNNDVIHRKLTENEGEAYRNALHRIRSEESMTKSIGR